MNGISYSLYLTLWSSHSNTTKKVIGVPNSSYMFQSVRMMTKILSWKWLPMVHFSVLVPIVPILRSKRSQKLLRKTSLHSRRTLGMLIVKLRYQKKMFSIALGVEPGLCFIFLSNYLMPPYRSRLITPFHVHDPIRSWIVTPTSSWTNKSETMRG